MSVKPDWQRVERLGQLKCSGHDCEQDLHNFKRKGPRDKDTYRNGPCVGCGGEFIEWKRIDERDPSDSGYLIGALKKELWRHYYWMQDIDDRAMEKARRTTLDSLHDEVREKLRKSVKLPSSRQFRDGVQTPKTGNVIYYAQHATATCCRKCIEEWYGISRDDELRDAELEFFANVILMFIRERLPGLFHEEENVQGVPSY